MLGSNVMVGLFLVYAQIQMVLLLYMSLKVSSNLSFWRENSVLKSAFLM